MSRALSAVIYFRSKNFEKKVQGTKMGYYSPNLVQINLESFTYKAQSDVINGPETIRSKNSETIRSKIIRDYYQVKIFRHYQVKKFHDLGKFLCSIELKVSNLN